MMKAKKGIGKSGLHLAFNWLTGAWAATHETIIEPLREALHARDVAAAAERERSEREEARQQGVDIAKAAFPNDTGNYAFKRVPIRAPFNGGLPLTPKQRFAQVNGAFKRFRRVPRSRRVPLKADAAEAGVPVGELADDVRTNRYMIELELTEVAPGDIQRRRRCLVIPANSSKALLRKVKNAFPHERLVVAMRLPKGVRPAKF